MFRTLLYKQHSPLLPCHTGGLTECQSHAQHNLPAGQRPPRLPATYLFVELKSIGFVMFLMLVPSLSTNVIPSLYPPQRSFPPGPPAATIIPALYMVRHTRRNAVPGHQQIALCLIERHWFCNFVLCYGARCDVAACVYVFIHRAQSGPVATAAAVVVVADVVGCACSVAAAVCCAVDAVACAFCC